MSMNYKYIAGGLIVLAILAVVTTLYPKDFKQMIADNPDAKYLVTFDILKQEGNVITPDSNAGYLRWRFTRDLWDSYYWGRLKEIESSWQIEYFKTYGDDEWVHLNRKVSTLKMNYTEYPDYLTITKSWDIYKYASNSGKAGTMIQDVNVYTDRTKVNVRFVKADENDKRDYRFVNKIKGFDFDISDISSPEENVYWLGSRHLKWHNGWYANVITIDEPEKFDYYKLGNGTADFYYKAGVLEIDPTYDLTTAETEILEDTYVNSGDSATNYGTSAFFQVNTESGTPPMIVSYLKFNLSSASQCSWENYTSASLDLWMDSTQVAGEQNIAVYQVWNQTWNEDSVVWGDRLCDEDTSATNGVPTNLAKCNTTNFSISISSANNIWANFSALQPVYNTSKSGLSNISFQISERLSYGSLTTFYSKENTTDTAKRPHLRIVCTALDTTVPQWISNDTSISSPATYSISNNYGFQIDWTDETAFFNATFELGTPSGTLTNYTNSSGSTPPVTATGDTYYINFTQDQLGGAGTYNFTWFGNDTSDNRNSTDTVDYLINKAKPIISMSNTTNSINTSGMVLYMPFSSVNSTNYTADLSGYGNDGKLKNYETDPPTENFTAGKYGNALKFDGLNDYTNISDSNSLDVQTVSVSAWVNLTNNTKGNILNKHGSYMLSTNMEGKPQFSVWINNRTYTVQHDTTLSENVWSHLIGTYDETSLKLYIDGSLVATKTESTYPGLGGDIDTNDNQLFSGGLNSSCPYGNMSFIDKMGGYCIDQYEASVPGCDVIGENCAMTGWANYCAANCVPDSGAFGDTAGSGTTVSATSRPNVPPIVSISRDQAKMMCSNAGKHLCSSEEWLAAANVKGQIYNLPTGAADHYIPNDNSDTATNCNTNYFCTENPSYTNNRACLVGSRTDCVSAEGVYDMTGNVWEWTNETIDAINPDDPDGSAGWRYINSADLTWSTSSAVDDGTYGKDGCYFPTTAAGTDRAVRRGGDWGNGAYAGPFCVYLRGDPSDVYCSLGFRCCSASNESLNLVAEGVNVMQNFSNVFTGAEYPENDIEGKIDEVRIYNRALSAEEIAISYNTSKYYPYTTNVSAEIDNTEQTLNLFRYENTSLADNNDTVQLSANEHYWIANVSATKNYTSQSLLLPFEILQNTTNPIDLWFTNATGRFLNQLMDITYESLFNATVFAVYEQSGTFNLYRDHLLKNTENDTNVTLGADTYNLTANTTGNVNYTSNSTSYLLTISQQTSTATLYLNNSLANASYYRDQVWNITGNCSNSQQVAELHLNNSDFGANFTAGIGAAYNTSVADLYHAEDNYNITVVCPDNGNYTKSSDFSWIDILPGFDFYLNATLSFNPLTQTQSLVEPTSQTISKPAFCVNNTRPETNLNISFFSLTDWDLLYNVTLYLNWDYVSSNASVVGMMDVAEQWLFNNTAANTIKCLYAWATFDNSPKGSWTPDLYSDSRLS